MRPLERPRGRRSARASSGRRPAPSAARARRPTGSATSSRAVKSRSTTGSSRGEATFAPSAAQSEHDRDRGPGHRQQRSLGDVPVAAVAQLVRHDELHLGLARRGEQRVVERRPGGSPPSPETYAFTLVVRRLASATSTLRTGTPSPFGEGAQLAGQPLVLERPEAVEERLQHDRRDEREEEHAEREPRRRRGRPPARERARERDGRRPGDRREHEQTARPFARSASQAPADWVENPHRRSRRKPLQKPSGSRTRSAAATTIARPERRRPGPAEPRAEAEQAVARPGEARRDPGRERHPGRERGVERPVVPGSPLDLFL